MATVDAFLKLDGIKGESIDSKHKDEIEVQSWSWGMNNTGTAHHGVGSGAGKVHVEDITIFKRVDTSSPVLMKSCAKGDHIKTGMLVVRKAGGDQVEYFKVELSEVLISSVQCASDPGSPFLTEQVSLNFKTFKVTYAPQQANGSLGAPVEFGYDLAKAATI
jgi:type VI secretion system secreted protein Hcp